MAIFELKADQILAVPSTTFGMNGFKERADLQQLLRTHIDVVSPDTMILAEEFGHWHDSKRRIDLLGLDKSANLVVIELKRTEDGGHMELQAIRYAAMVSTMTFEQAVAARTHFQNQHKMEGDAAQAILDFLDWDEPDENEFAQDVRIVLVAADFSKELTTAVLWLNSHDLDVRCVRLRPHTLDGRVLMDVQQIVPLPEATDYIVKVKDKAQKEREAKKYNMDFTRYDVTIRGQTYPAQWKRRAILLIAKALTNGRVQPETIAEAIHWRTNRMWLRVDGQADADSFVERATQDATAAGRTFDIRRWFCGDDELVHANGATYAFSNQWGNRTIEAMGVLAEQFPDYEIKFAPATAEN